MTKLKNTATILTFNLTTGTYHVTASYTCQGNNAMVWYHDLYNNGIRITTSRRRSGGSNGIYAIATQAKITIPTAFAVVEQRVTASTGTPASIDVFERSMSALLINQQQ